MKKQEKKNPCVFSHLTPGGSARMVNVSEKKTTRRSAKAEAFVHTGNDVTALLRRTGGLAKGNVLETARIAGIMAAKKTSGLIPMCHPLELNEVEIAAELTDDCVRIECRVKCDGKTGVEMEAMTAVSVAALTVYDMVKSAGKGIEIGPVRLLEKTGGKSGSWVREE